MNRQIALAYAVAGLSVAVAVVAVTGSTVGLLTRSEPSPVESAATAFASTTGAEPEEVTAPAADPVEYVYVDEPRGSDAREHDDDDRYREDDEHDEHERSRSDRSAERDDD